MNAVFTLSRYSLIALFAELYLLTRCVSHPYGITRPNIQDANAIGDEYDIGKFVYQGQIVEIGCDRSGTRCSCNAGEAFLLKNGSLTPLCIGDYGLELGCKFRFKNMGNYVRTAGKQLGTVQYHYDNIKNITKLTAFYWNMTWHQSQPNIFQISRNRDIVWIGEPTAQLRAYAGMLFKIEIIATGSGNAQLRSCLLLKVPGSRSYPLFPFVKPLISITLVTMGPTKVTSTTERARSTTERARSTTERAASTTERAASTPERAASTTERAASTTERAASTTERAASTTERAASKFVVVSSGIIVPATSTHHAFSTNAVSKFSYSVKFERTSIQQSSSATDVSPRSTEVITKRSPDPFTTSFSSPLPVSSSFSLIPTSGGANRQGSDSNTALIIGVSVGSSVLIVAILIVILLYWRKKSSEKGDMRKKDTIRMNLTAGGNTTNRKSTTETGNPSHLGNPVYEDKIRLNSTATNKGRSLELYDYAYQNNHHSNKSKNQVYSEVVENESTEPIYRELDENREIYDDTRAVYQPIDAKDLSSPNTYQSINLSTMQKEPQTGGHQLAQSPVYQELEEDKSDVTRTQSPIYQTVEPEGNQGSDLNQFEGLSERKIDSFTNEPIYRELENDVK